MFKSTFAAVIAGCCLVAPALADDATPDTEGGRYAFNKTADGFVRLDTKTGQVSLCREHNVGWACQAVPEDRAVFENEIERLRRENAALKKDLFTRGLPLPDVAMGEPPAVGDNDRPPQMRNRSDLQRAMAFVDRVWQRLVDAIARAQKQVLNKS